MFSHKRPILYQAILRSLPNLAWGCSSVVERLVRNQKVASSSLVSSIQFVLHCMNSILRTTLAALCVCPNALLAIVLSNTCLNGMILPEGKDNANSASTQNTSQSNAVDKYALATIAHPPILVLVYCF